MDKLKHKLPSRHVSVGPASAPHRSYYYAIKTNSWRVMLLFILTTFLVSCGTTKQTANELVKLVNNAIDIDYDIKSLLSKLAVQDVAATPLAAVAKNAANKEIVALLSKPIERVIGPNLDNDAYANIGDEDIDGDGKLNDEDPDVDNCPLVQNDEQSDLDGDKVGDACDIDYDGDGLIEIATADELNQTRHDLQGTSMKESASAVGSSIGCGNGADVNACFGYELSADIDLVNYTNWQPIGDCVAGGSCPLAFNGTFEGNGHIISNFRISISEDDNPVGRTRDIGLFGAISADSVVRGVHLRESNIMIQTVASNVGMLVGYVDNEDSQSALISNSSVTGNITSPLASQVGGLVGSGNGASIHSSYAENVIITGRHNVGGLLGSGNGASTHSSYVKEGAMRGLVSIGGLIGIGTSAIVNSSYVSDLTVTSVSSTSGSLFGGLLGGAEDSTILYSYAQRVKVLGPGVIGGLIGRGDRVLIQSSYARDSSVIATIVSNANNYGGLAGRAWSSKIIASYALNVNVSGVRSVGGLLGDGSSFYGGSEGRTFIGPRTQVISSYTRGGIVKGKFTVGGLVGKGSDMLLDSSYATTETISTMPYRAPVDLLQLGGLIAFINQCSIEDGIPGSEVTKSYWDTVTTKVADRSTIPDSFEGAAKTTAELQNPVNATDSSIYAGWANFWCNPDTGEFTSDSSSPLAQDSYQAWIFGSAQEYPSLSCTP